MVAAALLAGFGVLWLFSKSSRRRRLRRRIGVAAERLTELATLHFLAQPCGRCHENSMRLTGVSPNSRSLAYQCAHCDKKMRAPAATEGASGAAEAYAEFCELTAKWERRYDDEDFEVVFETAAAPLPFEQTSRTAIPEAVRSEVWRRDQGRCVTCGVSEQLEFDHIIPLVRGGATSVRNLQLLCRSCNASKGDSI